MTDFDVIVAGAGAAGLMCAIAAARRGRRVLVLEHQERVGKKIAISGGGRCNFTNLHAAPENYISEQPDFCKSALARYTPADFVAWVEQHGIAYHEKKLGQLFCDHSSRAIIEMLLIECRDAGVIVRVGSPIERVVKASSFAVATNRDTTTCQSFVVASGGLSFPKLGATDFGYRIAEQFGLRIVPPRPGLVPLTLAADELADFAPLSGVSLPVAVRTDSQRFEEALLFTHRGLSGPAILQISSFWNGGALHIDLLTGIDALEWLHDLRSRNASLPAALTNIMPKRFADVWSAHHLPHKTLAQMNAAEMKRIACALSDWQLTPSGTEGYAKAEVTCGGVDTKELSSKTMESRAVAGLYFIGEVVDVTGWLGGYNFQWAWASGHAAGQAV
ncbi:MAG TPA: NAD(P)/FAD-dependent oxidoreductase [Chthoniobacteraceae bacterium]|nr:NAD(P)/FAD-dependent oxidoreductase [Chthoniobacteraceae bacterium]